RPGAARRLDRARRGRHQRRDRRRARGRGRRHVHRGVRPARVRGSVLPMTDALTTALDRLPRARPATPAPPLEEGPLLPGGARLLVKRDDLTGLGMGGNKARKLELLCGAAQAAGADALVTVGAEQSNHARMTAAAGAILGLETHLVLGGDPAAAPTGN